MTRIRIASFSPILLVSALFLTSCKSQPAPATQAAPANQTVQTQYQTTPSQYQSPAQAGLQFINNPGGGQIFYGVVANQSTMNNAMIAILRSVHAYFGVQPQIGQFFQSKGSDSIATFFTLNANVQGGGTKAISGLVIVSMPQGSKPLGGAMFDDAANFSKTQPVMMNTLNQAWQNMAKSAPASGGASPQAAPQPTSVSLRQATAGDRSASIGLAPGWQITSVAGGHLSAVGPNGEMIDLDGMFQQIHDPRSMPYGGGGSTLVAPMGGDLFSSYSSIVNQVRRSSGKAPVTFHVISSTKIPPQAVQVIFEVDLLDGKGTRKGSLRLDPIYPRGLPTWAMTISESNAPISVFDAQNPTILAMIHSYSQNAAVIGQETQAVINNIHAIGARAAQQAADADSRRIASSEAFNQHMDDIDRSSKAFQNYQFDSSQLQVSGGGQAARTTVSNGTAAALVQSDPNHFQIVQSQDFIKGVDY